MADGVRDTTLAETSREVTSEGQTMSDLIKWLTERDKKRRGENVQTKTDVETSNSGDCLSW